jgi:hypothetical protein
MAEQGPGSAGQPYDSTLPSEPTSSKGSRRIRLGLGHPQSVVLIAVIAIGLLAAGLLTGELYARHRAERVVAAAVECAVHDQVRVSFGATPLLLQIATSHFRNISIHTAGNRIGDAQGMRADVWLRDVRLGGRPEARGTVGAINVVITWSATGMNQSIQDAITPLRGLVDKVQTNPDDGTLKLQGNLGIITTKPVVVGGHVVLRVVDLTGLSSLLPNNIVQSALDELTTRLTEHLPADIHADSIVMTKDGVTAHYSARGTSIPRESQPKHDNHENSENDKSCSAGS